MDTMRKYLRIHRDKEIPTSRDSGVLVPKYKFDWVENKSEAETSRLPDAEALRKVLASAHRIKAELEEAPPSVARTLPDYFIYREEE